MLRIPEDSVGLVTPQKEHFNEPLELACGEVLPEFELVYETYGELNAEHSNAVLICHALSGDHHAAGYHEGDEKAGWWETCIGPGKPIDTRRFFVVCPNNIGGCSGSTGPASINPQTGRIYGPDFPPLRVRDWVDGQRRLMQRLQIPKWAAVVGGSLGGMQAMRWSLEYPDEVEHGVLIASAMRLRAQNIAFNETARQAIISDPHFHDGRYLEENQYPRRGLAIARMIGHLTYMSDDVMDRRFGRALKTGTFKMGTTEMVRFEVESYLHHQSDKFAKNFDANTYLLTTRALDYFDLAREYDNDPVAAFRGAKAEFFIVSFTTDWRFAPERSREIVKALLASRRRASYVEIESPQGHDAFLLPIPRFLNAFDAYMQRVGRT